MVAPLQPRKNPAGNFNLNLILPVRLVRIDFEVDLRHIEFEIAVGEEKQPAVARGCLDPGHDIHELTAGLCTETADCASASAGISARGLSVG